MSRMSSEEKLRMFITEHNDELLTSLRLYVRRFGLTADAEQAAIELLDDVVIEALSNAERFDSTRHPMSWLLGIGINLIKRTRAQQIRLQQREPLVRDLYSFEEQRLSDEELFDQIAACDIRETDLERDETITMLLDKLSPADQHVIRLAVLYEMNGEALAQELGTKPGAARMRLHCALRRLRQLHGVQRGATL
jgi:RNA polymerase sigma factor (sigma-70 family)